MPEVANPPANAPTQDLGKTPTLLETLAGQMDISGAPISTAKSLPPIGEEEDGAPKPKPPEKKEEAKKEEQPKPEEKPEEKKTREQKKAEEDAALQKASETVAEKLFKKRPPREDKSGEKPVEKKVDEEKPLVKAEEKKPAEKSTENAD